MTRCQCLLAALLLLLAVTATADPVQWDGNGHYYELVTDIATWQDAERLAENRSWMGHEGYLATMTSIEENEWVFWNVVGGNQDTPMGDPWLGGYQNPDHSEPAENWHWVTTEPWEWTHWAEGEPNDYDENYAEMYLNFALWGDGFWNDHHSLLQKAYVVEYSSDAVQTEGRSWSEVKSMFR